MGASPSSFKVEETNLSQYTYSTLLEKEDGEKESFRLYRVTNLRFEAVLSRNDQSPKCLSLFRMDDEKLAREKFKRLYKAISPFYKSSIKCFNAATLQELIDTMEQYPDWSLADIAKHLDLRECLNHDRIAASSSTEKKKTMNPLQVACKTGKMDFIKSLTSINARDFIEDKLGNTPLHYAAENYPEVLISMIQKAQYLGVQLSEIIDSHNMDNQTALDVACHFSQDEGVKVLLEAGADVNRVEGYQKPIHTALKSNGTRCAALILEFHPEQIDAKDLKYGAYPLHWAKTKEAVHLLLGNRASIECKNNDGETALHVMARRRRLGPVIALLSSGANVNATSNDGSTPLHVAAQADDCDIVRALIVFGAEVNATNEQHHTPRHIATEKHFSRWKDVVDALCYVGASPCDPDKNKCNLPCKKEFTGELRIGDSVNKVTSGLFQSPEYKDWIKAAAVSAALYSSPDKDKADKSKKSRTKSVFKQKHDRDAVLSMDGGGIKGLVLVQLLSAIEEMTGESVVDLFDWIGGTSTGGILALALIHGKSTRYCQGLYFNLKDEVFKGPRPYNSEPLERFLKQEFGENTSMTSVTHPKALVTAVLADRRPASLYFFRNFHMQEDDTAKTSKSPFPLPPVPAKQQVWRAARGTGAAPTFFRSMGRFLDGGLMANNPTLDIMTEIHKYYKEHNLGKSKASSNIGLVVSLGTGTPPTEHVMSIDVFKPDSIWDATNIITGARALGMLVVDQACATHGPVVERARSWCEMIDVPFYRLSSDMSVEVGLDEADDRVLVKMLWETKVYVLQHFKKFRDLADKLTK